MGQKGTVSFSYRSASGFVFAVFLAVALPTVSCALGARWIDQYFATGYFFTILGIFLAFTRFFMR